MIAYHGNKKVKAKYIRRVERHRRLDQLVPGATGAGGKGCSVYCTFDVYDHSRGPVEIGVPTELMRINDSIFEGLARHGNRPRAMKWPTDFLRAIPEGSDLSMVWPQFALWMLRGLPQKSLTRPAVKAAVDGVAALYEEWIAGTKPSVERWRKARAAADAAAAAADAAAAAAYAAYADDAYAAYAAAATAATAAAGAAYAAYADDAYAADAAAAAAAYAYAAAWGAFWVGAADQLLKLLRGAPRGTPEET